MRVLMLSRDPNMLRSGTAAYARLEKYRKIKGVESIDVVVFSRGRLLYGLAALLKISGPFNLVTVQDPFEVGLLGMMLSRLFGAKLEVQIHTEFLNTWFFSESVLNAVRVKMARIVLPHADIVRVVSGRIEASLRAHRVLDEDKMRRVKLLPIAVEVKKYITAPASELLQNKYSTYKPIALMMSRITKEKDIGMVLYVFSQLKNDYKTLGLVVVGDGAEKENLVALVKRLGIEDSVSFESWTDNPIEYYRSADFFILSSLYEGYGMSLVEAAASRCPIVSSDVGMIGELISTRNAFVFPAGNKTECEKQIRRLLSSSKEDMERVKEGARADVENFISFEHYCERLGLIWRGEE